MDNAKPNSPQRHAIQLFDIAVRELNIQAHARPDPSVGPDPQRASIQISHSTYDKEDKVIAISARVEIRQPNADDAEVPYSLQVEIQGSFLVDEDRFPAAEVEPWAKSNGYILLYPFIREQVYALTQRCGYQPLILPLIQVPILKEENININKPPQE